MGDEGARGRDGDPAGIVTDLSAGVEKLSVDAIPGDTRSIEEDKSVNGFISSSDQAKCEGSSRKAYVPPHKRLGGSEQSFASSLPPEGPQKRMYGFGAYKARGKKEYDSRYDSSGVIRDSSKCSLNGTSGGYHKRRSGPLEFTGFEKPPDDEFVHRSDIGARNPHLEEILYGKSSDSVINFQNYDDIPVHSMGQDVPECINSFEESNLDELAKSNLLLAGYKVPTPVQRYSTPIISSGRNLMACAQTGSGKTAAFLVPILSQNFKSGPSKNFRDGYMNFDKGRAVRPSTILIAPTRELAIQIYEESVKFSYRSWVRPCVAYGGQYIMDQIREMDKGCEVLVATPGRLIDLIDRGKVSLDAVKYLVLDEADKMLDMGFEPQIRRIVEKESMTPVDRRQTLMFSATFPENIRYLAKDFLRDYIFLSVGRVGATSDDIAQNVIRVSDHEKRPMLLKILKEEEEQAPKDEPKSKRLTLCFVETRRSAEVLCGFLINNGYSAASIHGDKNQRERELAIKMFRNGEVTVLVATAVASRGLDIPNVGHVVNFDLPSDIDDYVHRIGRTGRAGNKGKATAFLDQNHDQMIAKGLVKLLRESKQGCPEWLEKYNIEMERDSHDRQHKKYNRSYRNNRYGGFDSMDRHRFPNEDQSPNRFHTTNDWY